MTSTPLRVLLPVCSVLLLLAGCGSDPAEPEVASLPTSAAPSSPSSAGGGAAGSGGAAGEQDPAQDRPVFRVDDTEERRKAVWNAFNACLLDNGATPPPADGVGPALGDSLVDYASAPASALQACAHLEPLQPPALDAATNPDFRDQSLAYVACLQEQGLWVTLLGDDSIDWTYTEGHSVPDDVGTIEQECLVQAFGGS